MGLTSATQVGTSALTVPTRILLLLLLLVGCRPTPEPTSPTTPQIMTAGPDEHSYARAAEVRVRHFGLSLEVDFATRTLLDLDGVTVVNPSSDPFFFRAPGLPE